MRIPILRSRQFFFIFILWLLTHPAENIAIQTSLSPGDTFSIKTDFASASAPSVQLSFLPPAALSPLAQERTSHKRTSKIKRPRKVTKRAKTSTGGNPDAITSDFSEPEVSESDELFYATRSVEDPSRPVRIIRRVVHDLPIIVSFTDILANVLTALASR